MPILKVSASIVSYCGYDDVVKCTDSILNNTTNCEITVYIVDNASPDGTGQKLQQKYKDTENVVVICNNKNLGFGSGHNVCIPKLLSDYHFVVNPDIVVDTNIFYNMALWLSQNTDVAICTPRLMFPNKTQQFTAKRKPNVMALLARQLPFKCLKKYEQHYLMQDENLSQQKDVEFCSGCFFAMPTLLYKQIGGFDETYFMYVEDADITQKALKKGRAVFVPQFYVYHAWNRQTRRSVKHFFMQIKSMLIYFKKWGFRWGFKITEKEAQK